MAAGESINVRLSEADIEALLSVLLLERARTNHREREHQLNNLLNKLSLPLQKARAKR